MTFTRYISPIIVIIALLLILANAVPHPMPIPIRSMQVKRAAPTVAPLRLQEVKELRAALDFYDPSQMQLRDRPDLSELKQSIKRSASPKQRRQQGYPTFPAQYPSCYNCQQNYSSLSSCMEASSVFENATSIFNSPWSYLAVLKCSCTDTFQAVFPQCVECFQLTKQCEYLGTDSAGTGAPEIVSNVRSICAFASSILGKAQSVNYPTYNFTYTPSVVPSYTDVTSQGPGYNDQATGAIFSSDATQQKSLFTRHTFIALLACLALCITPFIML